MFDAPELKTCFKTHLKDLNTTPQDPGAAGLVFEEELDFADLAESDFLESLDFPDSLLSFSTRLRLPDFLKSVSYQPDPLRRKPAADTNFLSAG